MASGRGRDSRHGSSFQPFALARYPVFKVHPNTATPPTPSAFRSSVPLPRCPTTPGARPLAFAVVEVCGPSPASAPQSDKASFHRSTALLASCVGSVFGFQGARAVGPGSGSCLGSCSRPHLGPGRIGSPRGTGSPPHRQGHCTMGIPTNQTTSPWSMVRFLHGFTHFRRVFVAKSSGYG